MKKLSIVIPHLNEGNEILETIKSINETADPNLLEIIAIDDCSKVPVNLDSFKNVIQVKNQQRVGVDGCRQMGVEMASSDYILILDGHMRMKKDDWLNKMIQYIDDNPKTLWCTVCLGLGYGAFDIEHHKGKYFGADLRLVTEAEKDRPAREIIEPKWTGRQAGDEYEIPCILGANYFFNKQWFIHIRGLKGLRSWGTSEPFMSIKSYLAGGNCKITHKIEIGHVFRDNAPYATPVADLVYNKIMLCKTILPPDLGDKLINYMPKNVNFSTAMTQMDKDQKDIEEGRGYYSSIFVSSIEDYCKKFNIKMP